MKAKNGVDLRYMAAQTWWGAQVADQLHIVIAGREMVVTCTGDGKHTALRSRHYPGDWGFGSCLAFDMRVWHLTNVPDFAAKLHKELGDDYVVIPEKKSDGTYSHIHVHWAPLYREGQ